jgi:hypothetical protein
LSPGEACALASAARGRKSRHFKSHARGRVFKRGKLIGLEISAASKFSSVMDKNRDGGAAVMPASRHVVRAKTCCAKTMIGEKARASSVPSNAARG